VKHPSAGATSPCSPPHSGAERQAGPAHSGAERQAGPAHSGAERQAGPAPASLLGRLLATALVALALIGCGTSQAGHVLRSANDYSYYAARYAETCPDPAVTQACIEKAQRLQAWHGAVNEAKDALARGGDCPLQVERLQRLAKEYPR